MRTVPSQSSGRRRLASLAKEWTHSILPTNAQIVQGKMIAGDQGFAGLSGSYVQATTLEDTDNDGIEEAVILLSTRLKSEES